MDVTPDSDVYINSISIVPGAGYDDNIGLNVPSTLYYFGPGSGSFTPGTSLAGGNTYDFYDIIDERGGASDCRGWDS